VKNSPVDTKPPLGNLFRARLRYHVGGVGTAGGRHPGGHRGSAVDLGPGRSRADRSGPRRRATRCSGVGGPLAVILGPAAFSLVVAALYVLLGGSWAAAPPALRGEASLVSLPLLLVILTLTDGLGEEPAWRGFALPRLLTQYNALFASLILGVLWAAWHLPLVWTEGAPLYRQPIWLLLVDMTAKSVLFTWVFLHTRGSVLLAAMLHASTNLFVVSPVVAAVGGLALPLLAAGAKWVLVVLLIAVAGPGLAQGPRPEALPKVH
jgi:membrane protease YdiL (CAAX protease family)